MKISCVVITKNEEKNIERCLESVQSVADEILVLDSHSTDQTISLAENLNAKVIQVEWKGYGATKNQGNSLASHDMILSMDADEALSLELQNSISQIKKDDESKVNGFYQFNRITNYCGKWIKHAGWYPDQKIRLFHRESCRWTEGSVHEKMECGSGVTSTWLKGDLLHYSYYHFNEHKERSETYAKLASIDLKTQPKLKLLSKFIFSPVARFIRMYFFQLGFLDGKEGLMLCWYVAKEVRLKYGYALR